MAVLSHTYTLPGTNTISLVASGPTGASSATRTNYIIATRQLFITGVRLSRSNVFISFTSSAGQLYRIEYSDLLFPASWSTAVASVPATGGIVEAEHLGGANRPLRFYRVRLLP
jgi:PKD repeat protein